MPHTNKILILEHDDFLREILGNLLHKKGGYILNGSCISEGLAIAKKHHIKKIILGTSCHEFKGKETLSYIKKTLDQQDIEFFILNAGKTSLPYIQPENQFMIKDLSIENIINTVI